MKAGNLFFMSMGTLYPTLLFTLNGLFTPLEIIGWSAFVLMFLLAISLPGRRYSIGLAGTVTALIIIGYYLSDEAHQNNRELILRFIAILVMWIVAYLSLRYKRVTEDIRKQNKRLDAIFENAIEGMIVTNEKGEIVMINNPAETLFGYTRSELIGQKMEALVPLKKSDNPVEFRKGFGRSPVALPIGQYVEMQAIRKDGTLFPVEINFGNFTLEQHAYVIAFIMDISKRKTGEYILKKEKELTQMYFDIAPVIFLILDTSGNVQNINKFGCKVLGYDKAELIGKNWFDMVMPEREAAPVQSIFEKMINGENVKTHENYILTRDKKRILIRWKNEIIKKENGQCMATLSAGEDVTEIKRQEQIIVESMENTQKMNEGLEARVKERTAKLGEALTRLEASNQDLQLEIGQRKIIEEKLERNQKLYNIMAHNFPNGIIGILNKDLRYILVDGSELERLGLHKQEMIGQKIFDDLFPVASASSEKYLYQAFSGKNVSFEVSVQGNPYNINAVPLPDSRKEINEILLVIHNVSDVKKIEYDLRRNLERETELNEFKSRFVTTASHEFRTPLSTILSSVFLLEKYNGKEFDEKKIRHIERIKKTVNNLTEILNDFLSLGKLEEGKVQPSFDVIEINAFMREVVKEMNEVRKDDQVISFEHTGSSKILLDKMLFRNIMINLVYNAIKYSPPGSSIEINSEVRNSHLNIKVKDHGIGIPSEARPYIFERFYRASNSSGIQGTGLGLHLVKKYSELMNGEVRYDSEVGVGTTFDVKFQLNGLNDN